MGPLQKVFETILGVLEIIKNFFTQLFPKQDDDTDASENA